MSRDYRELLGNWLIHNNTPHRIISVTYWHDGVIRVRVVPKTTFQISLNGQVIYPTESAALAAIVM